MRPYLTAYLGTVLVVAGLAATVHPVQAQTLAEVARQEEDRRKEIKAPAKVYTNKDLGAVPGPAPGVVSSAPVSPAVPAEADKDAAKAPGDKDAAKAAPRDQAYWSGRRKELQTTLDTDQILSAALQSRVNALTADFASHDDPIQRAGIDRDRQKALSELDRMRKSIEDGKKALADLEEAARKAGVPPGWLR